MRNRPSHPRACADRQRASGHPQDRWLVAATAPLRLQVLRWLVGCLLITPLVTLAQTPASTDAAQDRSQKQSDSVYRWIKMHAEPARRPEAAPKPRPKAEAAPLATRKPEAAPSPAPAVEAPIDVPSATAMPAPAPEAASAPASSMAAAPAAPAVEEAQDVDLRPISQPQPEIPRELRNSVSTGRVMLSFTVQTDGSVAETAVVRTTNRRLSRPALEAVSQWRFEPIRTARAVQVEIEFNLQ